MPNLDDEQFENHLRRFHPVVPESLPAYDHPQVERSRPIRLIWAVASLAAILGIGVAGFRTYHHRAERGNLSSNNVVPTAPLTIQGANALLATAPSYKAALNELAFRGERTTPKGKQSALAVLSTEKSKI